MNNGFEQNIFEKFASISLFDENSQHTRGLKNYKYIM
jgi:hypothetical protein